MLKSELISAILLCKKKKKKKTLFQDGAERRPCAFTSLRSSGSPEAIIRASICAKPQVVKRYPQ